jgi:hypothetical protein
VVLERALDLAEFVPIAAAILLWRDRRETRLAQRLAAAYSDLGYLPE